MKNKEMEKIKNILERGVEEVIDIKKLKKRLASGKKLRIKLGIDPTSPNIHIGRAVPLLKLRDFQEEGHKVVLIIGDFTGVIGDTSDKDSERPMLTEEDIKRNLKNYIKQADKIIDIKKCEVYYNSEWLGKLNYHEIGRQANIFSLNEFISRENIKKRLDKGKRVSLRELLYPLMQGYDSVAVNSDVEIGGTDQRFNLLAGREMQRHYNQESQDIITNPLIEGLDGRKMSSSWGNTINLTDNPNNMYGKVMSLKDELIIKYFILTTRVCMSDVNKYKEEIDKGANPMDYKMKLAFEMVKTYHSQDDACRARDAFIRLFKEKKLPKEIKEVSFSVEEIDLCTLLKETNMTSSRSEARRLVEQGGVKINGRVKKDFKEKINITKGLVIQTGKRNFRKAVYLENKKKS